MRCLLQQQLSLGNARRVLAPAAAAAAAQTMLTIDRFAVTNKYIDDSAVSDFFVFRN